MSMIHHWNILIIVFEINNNNNKSRKIISGRIRSTIQTVGNAQRQKPKAR